MNQQADSRKKNLLDAAMKPRNCQQGWFLSHTCDYGHNRKRNRLNALPERLDRLIARFWRARVRVLRADARAICARSIRAPAPSASAATARPARTKGVRAAAPRAPAPAGS